MVDDLDDRYDPDRWMAQGRNLGDFLSGGPEAELYYSAHLDLRAYVERWRRMMAEASYRAAFWRDIDPVAEEDLRDMWQAVRWRTL